MNIYVGNLHYEVRESELQQMMEEFGTVSSTKVITDRYSGTSKGFGFIEMDNNDDANKAIRMLNGKEFHGRPMTIKEANPRTY